ncbi:YitT family protein [Clostridium sp. DL1XJH146]
MDKKSNKLDILKNIGMFLVGCLLYSFYMSALLIPNNVGTGGLAGIALTLNHLFNFPVGSLLIILNIPLFIFGYKLIGKKFILKSSIFVILSSILIDLSNKFMYFPATDEKIIATIFAGVISGIAMSLLFMSGASTGGLDISAKMIKNKARNLDLTKILLTQDIIVYILVAFTMGIDSVLYAVIMSFIRTKTIDAIQEGMASSRQCIIISNKADDLVHAIQIKLGRGVTLLNAEGCYTHSTKKFIYVVVQKHQLMPLRKIVSSIDETAFVTVSPVNDILGNFKQKSYSVQ